MKRTFRKVIQSSKAEIPVEMKSTRSSGICQKIMGLAVLSGLLLTATSFTFGPIEQSKTVSSEPQKKEQHVKVIVNQNGKEIKIDTTFNLPDEKAIQLKVDSILGSLEKDGVKSGKESVIIMRNDGNAMYWNQNPGGHGGNEQFDVLIQNDDSNMVKHHKKVIMVDKNGKVATINTFGDDMMPPPPPPPPPYPVMKFRHFGGDPFAMDPNDEDIISYDKKDLGNGQEKITIVRKKRVSNDQKKNVNVKVEVTDTQKKGTK